MGPKDLNFVYWLFLVSSAGVFSAPRCSDNGFFSGDRTFDRNRGLILSALASNVTKGGGFYNASIGQDSDRVYAQGLCREGFQTEDCESCINAQSQELIKQCPNQTEAFSWGGDTILCLVSYSNSSNDGSVVLNPVFLYSSSRNLSSNLTQYDEIWQGLMNQTIETASAGTVPILRYYAVGLKQLTLFDKIYTVMQCTPDISQSDCNNCLRMCKDDYKACCHEKRGGIVARPSCYFRWELYPIHGAFEKKNTPPSPPPLPPSRPQSSPNEAKEKDRGSMSPGIIAAIVVPVVITILVLFGVFYTLCWKKKTYKSDMMVAEPDGLSSIRFDLGILREATNDFSVENKLGQGGFGAVFKGKFPNGQEIAVKRLSMDSGQGDQEFKNEILLLAGLQHRNLVKLLGFCLEGIEKLLVYEFVPNSSLDQLLFDLKKRSLLTWNTRFKIIGGIARGVLYLHEDSRLRIIHRDLKASNVLLDEEMNPKISDFGMARLFGGDETRGETSRVMGTFGYMSPEYARRGHFSVKSDVYSFGVLVLEILTGRKNTSFQAEGLPAYAWKSWSEGRVMDITDPVVGIGSRSEIMRCFHIGLLCVQESVTRRPTMNSVVIWLTSGSTSLPKPTTPAFLIKKPLEIESSSSLLCRSGASASDMSKGESFWYDDSVTELEPR